MQIAWLVFEKGAKAIQKKKKKNINLFNKWLEELDIQRKKKKLNLSLPPYTKH